MQMIGIGFDCSLFFVGGKIWRRVMGLFPHN